MGLPQEGACPAVACQDGKIVGARPAAAGLPEGQTAEGACQEAAPTQPEDLLQDTAPILTLVAADICCDDVHPYAPWHHRLSSCMRGAAHHAWEIHARASAAEEAHAHLLQERPLERGA